MIKKELEKILRFLKKLTCLFLGHQYKPYDIELKNWRWWQCKRCGKIIDLNQSL